MVAADECRSILTGKFGLGGSFFDKLLLNKVTPCLAISSRMEFHAMGIGVEGILYVVLSREALTRGGRG